MSQPLNDIFEGQLRRWCGGPPAENVSEHFMVIRIYTDEHIGREFVDFLQDDQVYRAFDLAGMSQLSEPTL